MPRLIDLIERLAELPEDATLYAARPWSAQSATEVANGAPTRTGLDYLLEVGLAREAVEVWSTWRGGRQPSSAEAVATVIYYAEHDAYEPIREGE